MARQSGLEMLLDDLSRLPRWVGVVVAAVVYVAVSEALPRVAGDGTLVGQSAVTRIGFGWAAPVERRGNLDHHDQRVEQCRLRRRPLLDSGRTALCRGGSGSRRRRAGRRRADGGVRTVCEVTDWSGCSGNIPARLQGVWKTQRRGGCRRGWWARCRKTCCGRRIRRQGDTRGRGVPNVRDPATLRVSDSPPRTKQPRDLRPARPLARWQGTFELDSQSRPAKATRLGSREQRRYPYLPRGRNRVNCELDSLPGTGADEAAQQIEILQGERELQGERSNDQSGCRVISKWR